MEETKIAQNSKKNLLESNSNFSTIIDRYCHFAALKSYGRAATFRQHYYPEGGWGWVITLCAFIVNLMSNGLQLSFGILQLEIVKHCYEHHSMVMHRAGHDSNVDIVDTNFGKEFTLKAGKKLMTHQATTLTLLLE